MKIDKILFISDENINYLSFWNSISKYYKNRFGIDCKLFFLGEENDKNTKYLSREYGEVEVDTELTIVCIVGHMIAEETGFASQVFSALREIPIRMISYGGSRHNISVLVKTELKKQTLQSLSNNLLNS